MAQPSADDMELFGDDDDEQTTRIHAPAAQSDGSENEAGGMDDMERRKRKALEYEEDEDAPIPDKLPGVEEDYILPTLGVPRSSDGKVWMLRLPQYLKVDSHPFHPDTFQGYSDKDKSQASAIKLELVNTIRWKWVRKDDGTMAKQSNARVIKWDDGTMSLQMGNEMFDISTMDEVAPHRGTDTPPLSQSQSQSQSQQLNSVRQQGVSYLVTQHSAQQLLQVEATIAGSMALRPAVGTQSALHRQLVQAVAKKHTKVSKLRFASDAMMREAEREADALAKRKPRSSLGPRTSSGRRGEGAGEGVGGGVKRRNRMAERRRRGEFSDDEDEDEAMENTRTTVGAAGATGEYEEDDFLVGDSDDYADPSPKKKQRKRRAAEDEDAEEDVGDLDRLDEMDDLIERRSKPKPEPEEDEEMDEEDEEESKIRKSSGKRRAFIDSDEE